MNDVTLSSWLNAFRPTFVFLKAGKEVEQVRGANRNGIESALRKYLGTAGGSTDGHSWGSGNKLGVRDNQPDCDCSLV